MKEPRKGKNPSSQESSSGIPSCRSERQRHATSHFNQNAKTSSYSVKPSLRRSILPRLASPSRRRVDPSPRSLMVRGNADLAHTGLALSFASRRDISHLPHPLLLFLLFLLLFLTLPILPRPTFPGVEPYSVPPLLSTHHHSSRSHTPPCGPDVCACP
jgi:hypothetical protein